MDTPTDPVNIARARIAEEAERRTGTLDLGGLGLTELPPEISALTHLVFLNIGTNRIGDDGDYAEWVPYTPPNSIADLSPIRALTALHTLDCGGTAVADLAPLAGLTAMQTLDCCGTAVADLTPLAGLRAMQTLICASTPVADLAPLAGLTAMQTLICESTPVADLAPLGGLTALQHLDCIGTRVADLTPLAGLTALQTLSCWGTAVADLAPLPGLTALQHLDCSMTSVADLAPLAGLTALQTLNCSKTSVADLAPLTGLTALHHLDCSRTSVADLAPLAGLTALQHLDCSRTSVADLAPLGGLTALQTLNCSDTYVADLAPLAGLTALQKLNCTGTPVADLAPLAGLAALQTLDCTGTPVADLAPLAGLTALQTLDCAGTPVADLAPLAGLTALQTLDCTGTPVADLAPLAGLTALQTLDCSKTSVADLAPLAGLPNLSFLFAGHCQLKPPPSGFWHRPSLEHVALKSATLLGVPMELLSSDGVDNCLPRLRAHLNDLEAGAAQVTDVKLLVLGNGRAGKTQLVRRLRGPDFTYQPEWDSTHGVQVATALLASVGTTEPTRLHIWDFGGQDIYHGTHALFTRARAIFATVWASDTEKTAEYERDGIRFRNHPLPYWVSYVRNNGGADSPLLIVQAKCDTQADERRRLPLDDALLDALPYAKSLHYSAAKDRGRAALNEALADAVAWLHSPERLGAPLIGRGRLQVQRRLEALRDADAARPPAERQHRTIEQAFFHELCNEAGGVSNHALFLEYLNNCGVVFHRPGLFCDAIVLDQAWALDAIYAVFQRDKCYRHLRAIGGRFTRLLLDAMVWSEFAPEEQRLFLSMMRTSGICFPHRQGATRDDDETEYIAPDLLPERVAVQTAVDALWDETAPSEVATYRYAFTHHGLIRALIARIGNEAGINAEYWRGGVALYEATTRSRARLDYVAGDDWSATLCVRTQTGRASELLSRLCEWVEKEQTGLGIAPTEMPERREGALARRSPKVAESFEAAAPAAPQLVFSAPPMAGPQWYVSYAWGDSSPEGLEREAIVDQLCERATELGKSIQRDKSVLSTGDSIAKFMGRIGRGDRVFVILSRKYLHSPFCVFELFEVWRTSQQDPEIFRDRVRVYALPDAAIFTPLDRTRIAVYWKQQHSELDDYIRTHGANVLAENDFKQYRLMEQFAGRVADILCVFADMVLPRTFEQLAEYGLSDQP